MGHVWKTADEVLDYAILEERNAAYTYRSFARQAVAAELKRVFAGLEAEERAHLAKLLKLRKASELTLEKGSLCALPRPKAVRLPADRLVDASAAYRHAIRAERNAWELYWVFGQMAKEPEIRKTLELLAAEELAHRTRLEADLAAMQKPKGLFRGLIRLFRRS